MIRAVKQYATIGQAVLSIAQREYQFNIQRITTSVNAVLMASDFKELYKKHRSLALPLINTIVSAAIVSLIHRSATPTLNKTAQWVLLNRIFAGFELFIERKGQTSLLNAGLQAACLMIDS